MTKNSFGTRDRLTVGDTTYVVHRLDRIDCSSRLPYSLKVLLENLARNEDGLRVTADLVSGHPQAVLITGQVLQQHLEAVGKPARAVDPVEPVDHVRGVADGEPVAGAETVLGHVGSGATSPMACRANVEWAYAPPARISEATQIASMISSGLAPLRRASLVCPVMQ